MQDLEGGLRSITVLGMDVLTDSNTKVRAMKDENREEMTVSPVNRVLTGDFIDVHTELYDVTSDPTETRISWTNGRTSPRNWRRCSLSGPSRSWGGFKRRPAAWTSIRRRWSNSGLMGYVE